MLPFSFKVSFGHMFHLLRSALQVSYLLLTMVLSVPLPYVLKYSVYLIVCGRSAQRPPCSPSMNRMLKTISVLLPSPLLLQEAPRERTGVWVTSLPLHAAPWEHASPCAVRPASLWPQAPRGAAPCFPPRSQASAHHLSGNTVGVSFAQ